jgi:RNA polymerase primary sigma factor
MKRASRCGDLDRYLQDIAGSRPDLTDDMVDGLVAAAQAGDEKARDDVIKHNLPLVITIAKKYYKPGNYDFLDVIAEGNLGLIDALERWDETAGVKFITYAWWRIRARVQAFIYKNCAPITMHNQARRWAYNWKRAEAAAQADGDDSVAAVARRLGIKGKRMDSVRQAARTLGMRYYSTSAERPDRIDVPEDAEDVPDEIGEGEVADALSRLRAALERLRTGDWSKRRSLQIINLRFGLGDGPTLTLREIPATLEKKISCERVRQIEAKTMAWLRDVLCTETKDEGERQQPGR